MKQYSREKVGRAIRWTNKAFHCPVCPPNNRAHSRNRLANLKKDV